MTTVSAEDLYGAALSLAADAAAVVEPWLIRYDDGRAVPLGPAVRRWRSEPDAVDEALLRRCRGSVLDVGCGPGRLVALLQRRGHLAVGVDVAAPAVALARAAGADVLQGSVFDELPGEGEWDTVLLADGNVGIGGDPHALLARCRELLRPGGLLLTETDPPGSVSGRCRIRLESPHQVSAWFAWAHVPADEVPGLALTAGLRLADRWSRSGRWFATLVA